MQFVLHPQCMPCIQYENVCMPPAYISHPPGADPGFEKGGGAVASGARSQDFFGQFRGLFKEFGAKRGGIAPPGPSVWIRACLLHPW